MVVVARWGEPHPTEVVRVAVVGLDDFETGK